MAGDSNRKAHLPSASSFNPRLIGFEGASYEAWQPPLYYVLASAAFDIPHDYRHKIFAVRAFDLLLLLVAVVILARLAQAVFKEPGCTPPRVVAGVQRGARSNRDRASLRAAALRRAGRRKAQPWRTGPVRTFVKMVKARTVTARRLPPLSLAHAHHQRQAHNAAPFRLTTDHGFEDKPYSHVDRMTQVSFGDTAISSLASRREKRPPRLVVDAWLR